MLLRHIKPVYNNEILVVDQTKFYIYKTFSSLVIFSNLTELRGELFAATELQFTSIKQFLFCGPPPICQSCVESSLQLKTTFYIYKTVSPLWSFSNLTKLRGMLFATKKLHFTSIKQFLFSVVLLQFDKVAWRALCSLIS